MARLEAVMDFEKNAVGETLLHFFSPITI